MSSEVVLFWFRRDLRLHDNSALYEALNAGFPVLPIYIFDTNRFDSLEYNDPRLGLIYQRLEELNNALTNLGSGLLVLNGNPTEVIVKLTEQYHIKEVYANESYDPYGIRRDEEICSLLHDNNIQCTAVKDHVIFEKEDILTPFGKPLDEWERYKKEWQTRLNPNDCFWFPSEKYLKGFLKARWPWPTLNDLGYHKDKVKLTSYVGWCHTLKEDTWYPIFKKDPASFRLSTFLRYGMLSIRQVVNQALKNDDEILLNNLIQRDFFMQIMWHYPESSKQNYWPIYDDLKWRNKTDEYWAWCEGNTGYALVDAGMRELNTTGYMHKDLRMITATFLCKVLLIDWRWGEAYFAKKLLDYDCALNVGNWQWVLKSQCVQGEGCRVISFEKITATSNLDQSYIEKWVPEYSKDRELNPIVDFETAKKRCLDAHNQMLE